MTLIAGTRLGPYEVVGPLGSGGMGEVFKARDTRLERSVAIKILPAEFSNNAQLRLRFEREAKTISQLSHPNICALYDVGDGYLVMELLEGETLADRIAKGPLPIDQVIRIGAQIGDALERAHKAGIVHRDLKPGNVMLTKSGAKLLDFGLAKEAAGLGPRTSVVETMQKPLTEEGTLIGTFQYMAPEQLEGAEADARTDIFALGAVLYEMATSKHAFEGKSKASLIASILAAEPKPVTAMQPATPATLDRIIRKCLEKDPDLRLQSAYDVATALRWIEETSAEAPRTSTTKRTWIPWTVAALAVLVVGPMLVDHRLSQRNAPVLRTSIVPPDKTAFDFMNSGAPPAISPDGTKVVFGAVESGKPRMLWVRALDSFTPRQLAGTEGAMFPFWSPDGRYVAFFAENTLKKVEVSGGAPVVLCDATDARGGSWSADGQTVIFALRYSPIYRVSAGGGNPVAVTKASEREASNRWPEFLPDSRHFLYLVAPNGSEGPTDTISVGAIDGSAARRVVNAASDPHYFSGCLVYVRDGVLTAQPFDAKKLAVTGDAFPLPEQQVRGTPLYARSTVSISPAGTIVYQPGSGSFNSQLAWFDRAGRMDNIVGDPAAYSGAVLSPDEKTVLTSVGALVQAQANIWSIDLVRGVKSRVTFANAFDGSPIWSPDGAKMIYTSITAGRFRFLLKDRTTGEEQVLLDGLSPGLPSVTSWSADGQRILYTTGGRNTRGDLWWMSLADRKPHLYLGTPFVETGGRFSPDGKWIAYSSDESGRQEVYIAPFPPTGAKWEVSTEGGLVPRWSADGKELFYVAGNVPAPARLMAVPVSLGPAPQLGEPVKLFDFRLAFPSLSMYDVSHDGKRFLINTRVGEEPLAAPISVVQHFDRELRDALEHHD